MNRFLEDSRDDDSSVGSDNSAARVIRAPSLVKLPSMYSRSPESRASSHVSSPANENDVSSVDTNVSSIDYDNLPVSDEIRKLFEVIGSYEPVELEIETPLKCFRAPYFPSVGEVDPMLNIPRPDAKPDGAGTILLDEPIPSEQSNAAVLELRLLHESKTKSRKVATVHSISRADNMNEIDEWIDGVDKIHSTKTPSEVHYQNKMPSSRKVMQVWPKEMNEELRNGSLTLPSADIDLDVEAYTRMLCSLLDIPVYEGRVMESIHVLLNAYVDLRQTNEFTS